MASGLSPHIRHYVLQGIYGMPKVIIRLVGSLPDDSPAWDFRPDPERFSLREILAHMADFDEVWLYRGERMMKEDSPELPNWDEDAAVIENNYAAARPGDSLDRLGKNRAFLSGWFKLRDDEDWARSATRPQVGTFTLEDAAVLILAHDAYHIQQITNWLFEYRKVQSS